MDYVERAKQCEAFARRWLITIARENQDWAKTGTLKDGKLRELATMCEPFSQEIRLALAESFFKAASIDFLANSGLED